MQIRAAFLWAFLWSLFVSNDLCFAEPRANCDTALAPITKAEMADKSCGSIEGQCLWAAAVCRTEVLAGDSGSDPGQAARRAALCRSGPILCGGAKEQCNEFGMGGHVEELADQVMQFSAAQIAGFKARYASQYTKECFVTGKDRGTAFLHSTEWQEALTELGSSGPPNPVIPLSDLFSDEAINAATAPREPVDNSATKPDPET